MSRASLRFISLVAYSVIGLGMLCNMIFYSTFGSGATSTLYALIGLLFDLAKIAFVGLFVYFSQQDDDQYFFITAICLLMWFALSALSLLASYGFLSQINEQYEMARLRETAIYAERQAAVEQAQAKLNQLDEYANVDTARLPLKSRHFNKRIKPGCSIARLKTVWDNPPVKPLGR
jgi:hypothetical protein